MKITIHVSKESNPLHLTVPPTTTTPVGRRSASCFLSVDTIEVNLMPGNLCTEMHKASTECDGRLHRTVGKLYEPCSHHNNNNNNNDGTAGDRIGWHGTGTGIRWLPSVGVVGARCNSFAKLTLPTLLDGICIEAGLLGWEREGTQR